MAEYWWSSAGRSGPRSQLVLPEQAPWFLPVRAPLIPQGLKEMVLVAADWLAPALIRLRLKADYARSALSAALATIRLA